MLDYKRVLSTYKISENTFNIKMHVIHDIKIISMYEILEIICIEI